MSYLNNANPRRMVWFSQNAPQSKTDLWLSYNLHYEDISDEVTNDEPGTVIDNPNQRNCDLVLKAWDCGQWVPIVGYNTTSVNKINTVKNAEPYVLIDRHGNSYTSPSGITEGHLPLFRKPADSPSELFDGGSVGDVLLHFVNKNDWTQIINNGGLGVAISSGVTIDIRRANATELGGIWARPFSTVNASGEYAEAKFKTSQAGTDDKLYVYGGDIVSAINNYYGGSGSGSTHLDIPLATTTEIGGIKSDIHNPNNAEAFKPVEIKFYPNYSAYSTKHGRLSASAHDIIDAVNEYNLYQYNNGGELSMVGGTGIIVLASQNAQTGHITTSISLKKHSTDSGKFLKLNAQGNDIEWVELPSGSTDTNTWRPIQIDGDQIFDNNVSGNTLNLVAGSGVTFDIQRATEGVTSVIVSASGSTGTIYTQGYGINISTGDVISCNISKTTITSGTTISMDTSGYKLDNALLEPYSFTELNSNVASGAVQITIDQSAAMKDRQYQPAYIATDRPIQLGNNTVYMVVPKDAKIDDNANKLITMQFRKAKIEVFSIASTN